MQAFSLSNSTSTVPKSSARGMQLQANPKTLQFEIKNRNPQTLTSIISLTAVGHGGVTENATFFYLIIDVGIRSTTQVSSMQVDSLQKRL